MVLQSTVIAMDVPDSSVTPESKWYEIYGVAARPFLETDTQLWVETYINYYTEAYKNQDVFVKNDQISSNEMDIQYYLKNLAENIASDYLDTENSGYLSAVFTYNNYVSDYMFYKLDEKNKTIYVHELIHHKGPLLAPIDKISIMKSFLRYHHRKKYSNIVVILRQINVPDIKDYCKSGFTLLNIRNQADPLLYIGLSQKIE